MIRVAAAAALLASPTVLAFFSGGYFAEPRLWAGIAVWLAVAGLVLAAPSSLLPRTLPARISLAGLAGLAAWSGASIAWAPIKDPALGDTERVVLYLGALLCATALLRGAALAKAVTPALAAGVAIVGGYGLAGRLLPGAFDPDASTSAGTRLDQPLTYWNAVGGLTAIGIVLLVRLASERERPLWMRAAAAGLIPPLSLTLFLTVSRGAIAALAAGVVVLIALTRDRRTIDSCLVALVAGGALVALTTRFPAVEALEGDAAARRSQGLAVLALTMGAAGLAAAAQAGLARLERRGATWTSLLRSRSGALAAGIAALVLAGGAAAVLAAGKAGGDGQTTAAPAAPTPAGTPGGDRDPSRGETPRGRQRLRTLRTNRYEYWQVALGGFADHPLRGAGAHGFEALWLKERDVHEATQDAHSLYLETLAELGLPGFALLLAFLGGAGAAAIRVRRAGPAGRALAAGWIAAAATGLVHTGIDWDWEMPAVALVLVLLAGALLAAAEELPSAHPPERDGPPLADRATAPAGH